MSTYTGSCVRAIAVLCAIATGSAVAQPPDAEQQVADAEEPALDALEDIRTRLARAYADLARVELQIALEANEVLPGTYSAPSVQRLRSNVQYAETLLQEQLGEVPEHTAHLRDLEGSVEVAETRLATALSVQRRLPETIRDSEIERLRVLRDLARLALEKAQLDGPFATPHDRLQWRMERMRYEILRLQADLDLFRPRP